MTQRIYDIPSERVIGSSNALEDQEDEHGGSIVYLAKPDVFDEAGQTGADLEPDRPAAGNSNGDIPVLQFAGRPGRPALRLLHDDVDREFDYTAGAECSLEQARVQDWTVISIKNDWATVFGDESAPTGDR